LSSTPSRISAQTHLRPAAVVLIFIPSLLNSNSPAALANFSAGAFSDRAHRPARSPSSSHSARIVSLLTRIRHNSSSFADACSNDQVLPATTITRRACSLAIRLPMPVHVSSGV
jgi:hypothetical protein